ncbi:pimeloyl-ACP methyl ester carboxylesterase [Actinomadura pelletieri DSM 43383]|uniref:Pimeloyl-ACP methyl ester carboxylesterase n=1 Tax=Actinomadura pelletieri DSM 43383 TaxID=1120940 RepID=A0A495QMP6_9ACTN|nr:alpha/beta hydrolase [Actinomadura pelletieri]RKS74248.1 pimeloyl-ACP methyl ester carboxylesterase [Actinomadura pelletieri DSM 43383]
MATFTLIPGAGGRAWYWHRLVPELQARGHDTIAVDLPAGDDSAGLGAYTDTVVEAIAGRTNVILVAQSMGGLTAPLVCERVPVALLVLLNAMVPRPGETGGDWWGNTGQAQAMADLAAREGRGPLDDGDSFFHDVPPDVKAEAFAQGEPPQSSTPFAEPWPLQAWPDTPTVFLQGRDDRFFPLDFQRRVVRERLGIPVDEMPGGHLVSLSRPKELAERLERYRVERTSL